MEELENLEETLNDSIKESLGARGKISHGKKKGATEDDEEYSRYFIYGKLFFNRIFKTNQVLSCFDFSSLMKKKKKIMR